MSYSQYDLADSIENNHIHALANYGAVHLWLADKQAALVQWLMQDWPAELRTDGRPLESLCADAADIVFTEVIAECLAKDIRAARNIILDGD